MRLSRNKIYKLLNGGKHQSRKKLKLQNNNNKKNT